MPKKYRTIIFLQDYTLEHPERERFEVMLDNRESEELFDFLLQWDMGDGGEYSERKPWGSADTVKHFDRHGEKYAVSYNYGLGYAALTEIKERGENE